MTGLAGTTVTVTRNAQRNFGAGSNRQCFSDGASVSLQLTKGAIETYVQQISPLVPTAESSSFDSVSGNEYIVSTGSSAFVGTLPPPSDVRQLIWFEKTDERIGTLTISVDGGAFFGPGCGSTGASPIP
ncbi:MAG: hypothetical protein WA751_08510 [Candidatus Dormiibacterota bacterium]